tara:strand:+ start:31 stop:1167 length:1137 start_codon:yes stop_codon:yes gene_type:complete
MLKNKIYRYLSSEILKNFTTVLLTFTAVAWAVRAVNFLELMVDDGHSSTIYLYYSILNISTIVTRFIPLAFLISLIISIIKFERQQELLILWTSGLTKVKIANIFLLIAFFLTLIQIILSLFINPYLLNKSRSLLANNKQFQINSVLKSNDFSDSFFNLTFYIDKKNSNNELLNIFIKDKGGHLSTVVDKAGNPNNLTIIAKKGFIDNNKLILFNGMLQTLNEKKELKNIQFEKTELSLDEVLPRTITQTKIQETSSSLLLKCALSKKNNLDLVNCSKMGFKKETIQTLSRRLGVPLYIPLISIITSFLLIYHKEKKYNYFKKYILFVLSFFTLIAAEIFLKYTGSTFMVTASYFIFPIIISIFSYIYLIKKMNSKKI